MKFKIEKETKIWNSFNEQYIKWKFDLQWESFKEIFEWDIDIENLDWNIWVIVGPSWSWKSTIATEIFWDKFIDFDYWNDSLIKELSKYWNINHITNIFNKVWFNTPKSWLKPYWVLSNWEKMRVDLAKTLLENKDISIFDEFTSVVDRQVAKVASHAISKIIKRENKKFIAVWCHYDILDWIEPDWVFDTKDFVFIKGVRKPTKDPQSNVKSENEHSQNGIYLKSIII